MMPQITTFRLYLLGMALLFGAYVALEYNRPKPLDWNPTYANKDKIPYGTYALYDQLPQLLGTDSVQAVRVPVYSQLMGHDAEEPTEEPTDELTEVQPDTTVEVKREKFRFDDVKLPESSERTNYLFVNNTFDVASLDAAALLKYAAAGNDVFMAAESFNGFGDVLSDTLGFRLEEKELATHKGPNGLPVLDSVRLRFTNPALARARVHLPGRGAGMRLLVDPGRVGRTLATDAQGRAVFIRLDHGRGHFYICSTPTAFANYQLVRPRGADFAAAALSYLPARHTWWDEFQKQGPLGEQSLLRVVFAHEALRYAYYLALAGGLLFVLIEARRRQRIIPTINPLPNTTLLFTRTVASLYRQGSNHGLIAEKKVGLFLDYLRTRFQETSPDLGDDDFQERLSQKSGLARSRVNELLRLVNFARTAPQMNDQQLLQLSRALSDFRREAR